jgi:hypothetical protein
MYQNATIDNAPGRENAVWIGVGLNYFISDEWAIFGGYSFEGDNCYQLHEYDIGARFQF